MYFLVLSYNFVFCYDTIQIPRAVIEPICFASLVFGVAGLRGGFMGWLWFTFICILCANYANAYGKITIDNKYILKYDNIKDIIITIVTYGKVLPYCHFCINVTNA